MRWSKPEIALAAVALFCAMAIAGAGPGQQLTVYTAQASYSLPVFDRGGKPYIAVADLLSPVGASAPHLKGKEWRLELNKAEARFTAGKDKAAIRGQEADLSGKALVEDGRVMVPLAAALPLLSRLLNTTVDFHQPSRRIFVGNVSTRFTAEFKDRDAPSLVLNFSQPLKLLDSSHEEDRGGLLFTHTNKTTLTFRKDPLVSDLNKQDFGAGAIQSLSFAEENGTASITVTGNKPLQIIRSEDGKTITLQPQAPAAAASPEPTQQSAPATAEGQRRGSEFFVMIDPSHGGNDKGATFGGKLVEKDITLRLARELRKELEERGIATRLLRDSDIDLSLERRAEITNEQHAGLYVALHAGRPGKGVRVYASFLTDQQPPLASRFMPWESAQSGALGRSQIAARAVSDELRKKGLTVANLAMPVRPLNNLASPAIAVELTPEIDDPQSLENQKRQNSVAAAVAAAIAQVRSQLGGPAVIPRHFQITIVLVLLAILISGVVIIRMTHKEEALTLQAAEAAPVAPVVGGKQEHIQVLVAYDDDQALRWRPANVFLPADRGLRARETLRYVLAQYLQTPSPHPLGKGSDIKDVYFISDDTMIVDTTAPFADGHPSGILLEEMTLTSLIETLTANVPGIAKVKFLVDGKERETLAGHADLMSFYKTAAVHELAKEFE